ncbi:MAG: putative lipid II flippase FtsW [Calditrichaeota bacterium]|nr:MAG: putative lipid II flippase FtsW [Calditrichota bacterium]
MRIKTPKIDYSLLLSITVLLVISLTFIYTASSTKAMEAFGDDTFFLQRQMLRILFGFGVLLVIMRIDYHKLLDFSPIIFWVSLTLLIVLLVAPEEWTVRGTRRWLNISGFRFQPSEIAKFALILMYARVLSLPDVDMRRFVDSVLPQLLLTGVVCSLIILEPDMGTTLMVFMICIFMLFVAGAKLWHLATVIAVGLLGAAVTLAFVPYQRTRLLDFWHSYTGKGEIGWQIKQSLISLGNGGITGIGLGGSRQKMHWLPDPFTDFIGSIIGEELGLLGTLFLLFLFIVIIFRGFRIALAAPDREGQLLAAGITIAISLYAFMNIAVITHLAPTTGIPIPFVSYGGSSLVMNLFGVGILMNINHHGSSKRRSPARGIKNSRSISKKVLYGL